jgi:hypothetical protein
MNATRRRAVSRVSRLARVEAPVLRRTTPAEAMAMTPAEAAVAVVAKRAAWAASIPAETLDLLRAGKLEQTCRDCGRREAAGHSCSWCARQMGPGDWYRNEDGAERAARMPTSAPADPPVEFRRTYRPEYGDGWPPAWGPNPFEEAARARRSRVNAGLTPVVAPRHTSNPDAGFWPV